MHDSRGVAKPHDLLSGALVLGLGLCLIFLAATGLVFRYVQPGFRPWVGAAGALLTALGVWTFSSIAEDRTAGPFPRVGTALLLPILLVALVLPGALQFASTGPSKLVPDQPHPALTSSVNEMTLLELYERYFFDDPALLDGHTIRTAGMLHRGDNGWEVRRFRIICCAADASEYAVPITGTVPHAQEGKWVEVIGTASTQPELALTVRSITSIREPARPYL